ncbi:MAG: aminotransferase class III-fold pyridoxal phosphate-dependent enzyme [Chloroflexi bacterium]|nr:MAG: aminotransferase class III-fold pyridoxal phosphate-dependent enzyme [Chloroflexota bacterium]
MMNAISSQQAVEFARNLYGIRATAQKLNGEYDHNFLLTGDDGAQYVLKLMHPDRERSEIDLQVQMLRHLAARDVGGNVPRVEKTIDDDDIAEVQTRDGKTRLVWMLHYLPHPLLADTQPHDPRLLMSIGQMLGKLDRALVDFSHPAAHREHQWDIKRAAWIEDIIHHIEDDHRRALVSDILTAFKKYAAPLLPDLRHSIIHGDANDYNLLVDADNHRAAGIIDFGDAVYTATICNLAIVCAYAMLGKRNPLHAAAAVIAGYHEVFPLTDSEIDVLYTLICTRLAVSVTVSAQRKSIEPDNAYYVISERPAWHTLEHLAPLAPDYARYVFRVACGKAIDYETTRAARQQYLGGNLSLTYQQPLKIVYGRMQYLYDEAGRAYLDFFNNVPQVGHSHPAVVRAAQDQLAMLNTNTRYLHDNVTRYAERLSALMPDSLEVCYFLNSASEANELALRLARTYTGAQDVIVLENAYHGHTGTLIDISPYKFMGPGGAGKKDWVHIAPIPDDYRGVYRRDDPARGAKYAQHVADIIAQMKADGRKLAAFIAETLPSVGGQIVPPLDYLQHVYRHVRAVGGVCIADEVQVGLGRLGTFFWGFEMMGVVPDIVVLGKPIGNGFPLAAVVTTRAIADAFDNGMEFFSTFGGNPVACAAGLAVLDVLEREQLPHNAQRVGRYLRAGLERLQAQYPLIGDVRGVGLFLGVELVNDRATLDPATQQARYIVNRLREEGVLAGTDGPHNNVLKLRPPLIINARDVDLFLHTLTAVLNEDDAQPASS